MKLKVVTAWAVLAENSNRIAIVLPHDGEENMEIYRTRRLAKGAAFTGERVVKVKISYVVKLKRKA